MWKLLKMPCSHLLQTVNSAYVGNVVALTGSVDSSLKPSWYSLILCKCMAVVAGMSKGLFAFPSEVH